jgi:L-alanine-DL-glutamate epimerase-like enolase superfamily enzyme
MSRRPASYTQADLARAIRAAKQEGAIAVELRIGEATIVVHLEAFTAAEKAIETPREVIL